VKSLHRSDLFAWAAFDEARNLDFNGHLLVQHGGANVAFDPMTLSAHDVEHIDRLGGVDAVMISNADHVRAAADVAARWGARIAAPAAEEAHPDLADLAVDTWLQPDDVHHGVTCLWMQGSKTRGELAFLMPGGDTLLTGDLVRGQRAGALNLLPAAKLRDRAAAVGSVARLAELPGLEAVLVGDGQSIFRDGAARLRELVTASG